VEGRSDRSVGERATLVPEWATTVLRLALAALAAIVVALPTALFALERSPYVGAEQAPTAQAVKFDHRHYAARSFTTGFCLDCHRAPEPALRPRGEVTDMTYMPERALNAELGLHEDSTSERSERGVLRTNERSERGVPRTDDCGTCHR
jgi:hypothetical protein